MNQFPEIRLDLQGLKMGVIHHLSSYNREMEEYVGAELEKIVQDFDFDKVIRETSAEAIKSATEKAIKDYFNYGEGFEEIKKMVAKRLTPTE